MNIYILYIDLVSLFVRLSEWTEPHFFQDEAPFLHSSKIHKEVLRRSSLHKHSKSVCLWWGFWGVGEGEAGEAAGDHHGFCTGQVYKLGPDLHKTLQPSEGKEWQLDRIPLPPH